MSNHPNLRRFGRSVWFDWLTMHGTYFHSS